MISLLIFGCTIEVSVVDTGCCCVTVEEDSASNTDTNTDTGSDSPCTNFEAPSANNDVSTVESCVAEPAPITFSPEVEWVWAPTDSEHLYNHVLVTPMIGPLGDSNGDGLIDEKDSSNVVFTAYENPQGSRHEGALVILDGATGSEQAYYTSITDGNGTTYQPPSRGGIALGDIDADGIPEICMPTLTAPLICLHQDGTVVLVGASPSSAVDVMELQEGFPTIGDMDGDGMAEIAIGRVIWDHTGTIVGEGEYSHGGWVRPGHSMGEWWEGNSVMYDMDDDGHLELVAGNVVYERDGSPLWLNENVENGYSAVADIDLDGDPDVITSGMGWAYIMDGGSGALLADFELYGCDHSLVPSWGVASGCGSPTIADFDADGEPEIGIAGDTHYTVYDNSTGNWIPLWSNEIQDHSSGRTGASVFDFEADGEAEVVFSDEDTLHVWTGSIGADRLGAANFDAQEQNSGTAVEYPSLADVDGDGSTEILLASNHLLESGGWFGVRCIGSGTGPEWAGSRPVWNQHTYHITNVGDDLSIPADVSPNYQSYNNFRTQDQGTRPANWLPDLIISNVEYCANCDIEKSTFYVVVDNQGLDEATGVDMVISDALVGELIRETISIQPQESQLLGPYLIDNNDWMDVITVYIDIDNSEDECDESNNVWEVGTVICD